MIEVSVTIDRLSLDTNNARIEKATSHLDALNRIVSSQKEKLVRLALDIVDRGLSPFERLAVLEDPKLEGHYIVLEGNRRTAALKLLSNSSLDDQVPFFETKDGRKILLRFRELRNEFDRKSVEPIRCVVLPDRESARPWLQRRHSGEMDGIGLTAWSRIESLRAFDPDNKLVSVADFVRDEVLDEEAYLGLSRQWSTVERLIEGDRLRARIGLELDGNGILQSRLPLEKLVSRFRAIVEGLSKLDAPSRRLDSVEDRLRYLDLWLEKDEAQEKDSVAVPLSQIRQVKKEKNVQEKSHTHVEKRSTRTSSSERKTAFKRGEVAVSDDLAQQVYAELCSLKSADYPIATTVLLRLFLEITLKKYAKHNGIKTTNKGYDLKMEEMLRSVHDHLKSADGDIDLEPVTRNLNAGMAGHHLDYFHAVVHGKSTFPSRDSVIAITNEFRGFLIKVWDAIK